MCHLIMLSRRDGFDQSNERNSSSMIKSSEQVRKKEESMISSSFSITRQDMTSLEYIKIQSET